MGSLPQGPEYWQMLAQKVDGEHPTRYYNLLLAVQKLERQAEARDPLLPKIALTGGSNVTHSQTSGNLFPSQKLKGSHTFITQSAMVESNRVAEGLGLKAEVAESSDGEDQKPQLELEEQINWLGISSILPKWSSYIRGKIKIVSDLEVLTIL